MRHLHAALIALIAASTALAATSGREPLALKEPAWKGSGPDAVTPDYREALAMLQAIASEGADGPPLRVTSPSPCVLRLERGDDVARFADEGRAFLHQVTWIDLARA